MKSKKYRIIIIIILCIPIRIFLYNKSFLTQEQIRIFLLLRKIGAYLVFLQKTRAKIISILCIIGIGGEILLGFLPLYNKDPNKEILFEKKQIEYTFKGEIGTIIDEKNDFGEKKLKTKEKNQKLFFEESKTRKIEIKSITPKAQIIIELPDDTIYIINEESASTIIQEKATYIIRKEYGNVEYYQPLKATTNIKNTSKNEKKTKSEFSFGYILEKKEREKKEKIINNNGGILITQPNYQKIAQIIINIASKIRPKIYTKNKENIKKRQEFLGQKDEDKKTLEKIKNNRIIEQFKKGRKETKYLQ